MAPTNKKKYFRMGEMSGMTGLEPHVVRYWETEFPQLKPRKTSTGQRTYTEAEVDMVLRIKRLLHEEGYTIAGARRKLEAPESANRPEKAILLKQVTSEFGEVRGMLKNVLKLLDRE